ncbi:ABC transporter substrate-binding protein [Pectobacterium sp. A5351]|uniref:ABC transporter substrate-binding protein n=1 Tax=Pectobacterium sp. A5351 TaxID=2914983 RepID=UPI00232F3FFD|nr:ABC transporter substrate-binding protein [Pectobacterium sp. A5351]WCG84650.1 ABC transporter substrate-binding protein [Pectobacterium sp. A5351]
MNIKSSSAKSKICLAVRTLILSSLGTVLYSTLASAAELKPIEVLHAWSSAGEGFALSAIKDADAKKGLKWKEVAVGGNNGTNQMQVIQSRISSGNPPDVTLTTPTVMFSYVDQGALVNLDDIAKAGNWEKRISPELLRTVKYKNSFYAIPIGEHRENVMFANKKVLAKYGEKVPETWDEFNVLAEKMQKDGIIPVALGGEDWQETQLFSSVIVGVGGKALWKSAIEEHDAKAIQSPEMLKVFEQFRKIINFSDRNRAGRDWNVATQMVMDGKAAFQFIGDFAKGEFTARKLQPGVDFLCATPPGNGREFVYMVDEAVIFKKDDPGILASQKIFSEQLLDPEVQQEFSIRKGSIPVTIDAKTDRLDSCALKNLQDRAANQADGGNLPSFVQDIAQDRDVRGVFVDAITKFANTPTMTAKEVTDRIVKDLENL